MDVRVSVETLMMRNLNYKVILHMCAFIVFEPSQESPKGVELTEERHGILIRVL